MNLTRAANRQLTGAVLKGCPPRIRLGNALIGQTFHFMNLLNRAVYRAHFVVAASVFVFCSYLKKAKSALAHCAQESAVRPGGGKSTPRSSCHHILVLLGE